MKPLILLFFACLLAKASSAPVDVSITVEHQQASIFPKYAAITEPSWVTELLGPTKYPVTTTKRPSIPQRIRDTIKQVQTTINGIPERINGILEGIQKEAQNIIAGPGGPRTTGRPKQRPVTTTSKSYLTI